MEVAAERNDLLAALKSAKRGISKRATLPVLQNYRLEANGSLVISGTDLDLSVSVAVDCRTFEEGWILAPAQAFEAAVKSLPKGSPVHLRDSNGELEVMGKDSATRMKTGPRDDFPTLPKAEGNRVTFEVPALLEAISRTAPATSTDETRQVLTAVSLEINEGEATFTATDSYRLATYRMGLDVSNDIGIADAQHLLPRRFVIELAKVLKKAEGAVALTFEGYNVTAVVGSFEMTGRLVEGQFPNWKQLLPSYQDGATIDVAPFMAALERVAVMAQNNLPVRLTIGTEAIELEASTPDVGEAREEVRAEVSGESLLIAFNPDFLAAGIESCHSERVTLSYSDALRPAVIRPESSVRRPDDFLYLLMPVRLS